MPGPVSGEPREPCAFFIANALEGNIHFATVILIIGIGIQRGEQPAAATVSVYDFQSLRLHLNRELAFCFRPAEIDATIANGIRGEMEQIHGINALEEKGKLEEIQIFLLTRTDLSREEATQIGDGEGSLRGTDFPNFEFTEGITFGEAVIDGEIEDSPEADEIISAGVLGRSRASQEGIILQEPRASDILKPQRIQGRAESAKPRQRLQVSTAGFPGFRFDEAEESREQERAIRDNFRLIFRFKDSGHGIAQLIQRRTRRAQRQFKHGILSSQETARN